MSEQDYVFISDKEPYPQVRGGNLVAKPRRVGGWDFNFKVGACNVAFAYRREHMAYEKAKATRTSGPSDAEIVAVYERIMHGDEVANGANGDWRRGLSWSSGGRVVSATWAEYQAARSRELNRRITASSEATKEAERRRVLGPIDDIDL
jgi:hypothetical protein